MSKEAPWMDKAKQFLGLKEIPGSKHEKRIIAFAHAIGHTEVSTDEEAWCAYFLGAQLEAANFKSTRSGLARSYENFGEKLKQPREGCIVVLKRGNSTWQGHVGFYVKGDAKHVWLLSGNASNMVSIAPYSRADVIAYRWPTEQIKSLSQSKTAASAGTIAGTATVDAANTIEKTIEHAKNASDVAEKVGAKDWLPTLLSQPRFWIAVVIIVLALAIIYWRWREHGRGEIT